MDSDEDLFRSLGCRMPEHLQTPEDEEPRQAQPVSQSLLNRRSAIPEHIEMEERLPRPSDESDHSLHNPPVKPAALLSSPESRGTNGVGFFDVGGLLEENNPTTSLSRTQTKDGVTYTDFAPPELANPSSRRPSHAFMQDIGVLPSPTISRSSHSSNNLPTLAHLHQPYPRQPPSTDRPHYPPTGILPPILSPRTLPPDPTSLQDAGGLLSPIPSNDTSSTVKSWEMQIPTGMQRVPDPLVRQDTQASLGLQDLGGLLRSRTLQWGEHGEDVGPKNEGR